MSNYDLQYADLVRNVIDFGYDDKNEEVRAKYATDGAPAHAISLISEQFRFNGKEVPILTTKRVAWKTAIHELIWFYIKRTSDVSYLRENGVTIWEEWTKEDGSIGKAYGYQLGKPIPKNVKRISSGIYSYDCTNQVHKLIDGLKNSPASRRHVISLWSIEDLHDMALPPCVWNIQCVVQNGVLSLVVGIRSNDIALGQAFNFFQYHVLQRMLAQVTGLAVGELIFNVNIPHIYDRHVEGLLEQIEREPLPAPKLWTNQAIKDFDDFTINDFILVNPELTDFEVQNMSYEEAIANAYYNHHPSISFEVAV